MQRIWGQSTGRKLLGLCLFCWIGSAQTLAPRAYVIVPRDASAIILTYNRYSGGVELDAAQPIADLKAQINVPIFSFYHSFGLLGRSANFTASLPYLAGNYTGAVRETAASIYRSGLVDSAYRLSVNLIGGPAMSAGQFATWRQKTLVGISLIVLAPTGQYDPARLVNPGADRWVFKPELGFSRRSSNLLFDAYASAWLYTQNRRFFPGTSTLNQDWIGALEMHLSYDVRPRMWVSLDGNYWFGGSTVVNGSENANTRQGNSRVGLTASLPLDKHTSFKFSYSRGARVVFGGDFQQVAVGWQYGWIGKSK